MPIQIIRNDLTRMTVDAIVNTTNRRLLGSGGVDQAIHRAAGPGLDAACAALSDCDVGDAKITLGFLLPCRYVIHTVSPVWRGGFLGEKRQIAACYRRALEVATAHGCHSIAFPLIAAGAHGCPTATALHIATDTINDYLLAHVPDNDMMVYLVVFSHESLQLSRKLVSEVRQYIDDRYVDMHTPPRQSNRTMQYEECCATPAPCMDYAATGSIPSSLEEALRHVDESFSQMILRKIKEKGMKNADCYKRANIDKKLFSKIINTPHYNPRKSTALAIAIALELPMEETHELLTKAGYALSHSDKGDIIVEYFISKGRYNVLEINEVLYEFDLVPLGSNVF